MKKGRKQYDVEQKSKAKTRVLLRALISAYLMYLAYQLIFLGESDSALPAAVCWLAGGIFAVAAIAFGIYSWKQYQISLKESELPSEDEDDEEQETDL